MNDVLIIEDEQATANAVKEALALNGIHSEVATNGTKGLEMFDDGQFDLILLDLKMPGLSGEEVLTKIREKDPFIDVLIYTNYSDFADTKRLVNIGIDGYINKGPNADLSELIKAIKTKLEPLSDGVVETLLKDIPTK